MFWVVAAILWFGAFFYCVFGSGELQPWAVPALIPSALELLHVQPALDTEKHSDKIEEDSLTDKT